MSDEKNKRLFKNPADTEIRFFSAVTASVTHELNNVLSIINQTGGLLEDHIYGLSQGQEIDPEKLKRIAESVEKQTQRGIGIIRQLNYFAHTCDNPATQFDIGELISTMVSLSGRFADLTKMKLNLDLSTLSDTGIYSNPFLVEQIVFLVLKGIFLSGSEGDVIDMTAEKKEKSFEILIKHTVSSDIYQPDLSVIEKIAGEIEGTVEKTDSGKTINYKINIPDRS